MNAGAKIKAKYPEKIKGLEKICRYGLNLFTYHEEDFAVALVIMIF